MARYLKSYHDIEVVAACMVSLCNQLQDCTMPPEEWTNRFWDNCEEMYRLLKSAGCGLKEEKDGWQ